MYDINKNTLLEHIEVPSFNIIRLLIIEIVYNKESLVANLIKYNLDWLRILNIRARRTLKLYIL